MTKEREKSFFGQRKALFAAVLIEMMGFGFFSYRYLDQPSAKKITPVNKDTLATAHISSPYSVLEAAMRSSSQNNTSYIFGGDGNINYP